MRADLEAGWKRNGSGARLRYRYVPDYLYFPSPSGDARYRSNDIRLELRRALAGPFAGILELGREWRDFHSPFDPRDAREDHLEASVERESRALRMRVSWSNDHRTARSDAYDRWTNAFGIRLDAWRPSGWRERIEASGALANYFPSAPWARNFRRQDRDVCLAAEVSRSLGSGVHAGLRDEWRRRESTRSGKSWDSNLVGLVLGWEARLGGAKESKTHDSETPAGPAGQRSSR